MTWQGPDVPRAVTWHAGDLYLLDQTRLPHTEAQLHCTAIEQVFDAIVTLKVRGAPAIGIAAAYGLLVGLAPHSTTLDQIEQRVAYLVSARPTAVNLAWALQRMLAAARQQVSTGATPAQMLAALHAEAGAIHAEDQQACRAIGSHGAALVASHPRVLTHCNAGALAVSAYGTALAPIYAAAAQGVPVEVFVDETRPLLQGARLTAFELGRAGIPRTLISDNMAAHVMARGMVDMVLVGTDRIAANGDVANKIGTLNLAVLCDYFKIPFYVACPASTIDLTTATGGLITIEQRHPDEVRCLAGQAVAEVDTPVFNPAFDITPAALVTGIITERGILQQPLAAALAGTFAETSSSRVMDIGNDVGSGNDVKRDDRQEKA